MTAVSASDNKRGKRCCIRRQRWHTKTMMIYFIYSFDRHWEWANEHSNFNWQRNSIGNNFWSLSDVFEQRCRTHCKRTTNNVHTKFVTWNRNGTCQPYANRRKIKGGMKEKQLLTHIVRACVERNLRIWRWPYEWMAFPWDRKWMEAYAYIVHMHKCIQIMPESSSAHHWSLCQYTVYRLSEQTFI